MGVQTPALATGPVEWSSDVDVDSAELITGADGSVTSASCGTAYENKGTETFSASGTVLGSTPIVTVGNNQFPALSLCNWQKAVGVDGTLYGDDPTGWPVEKLAAYTPTGTNLWSQEVKTTDCPSSQGTIPPIWIRVGADGNIYTGGQSKYDWCGNHWYLTSYTPEGTLRWQVRTDSISLLAPYNNGVVIGSISSREIQYFGYDGTSTTPVPVTETAPAGLSMADTEVTASGVVTMGVYNWMDSGQCGVSGWTGTSAVVAYGPSGEVYNHPEPPCRYDVGFASLPDGGVAYIQDNTDSTASVQVLNPAGSPVRTLPLPVSEGDRQFVLGAFRIMTDTNGRLLLARNYTYPYQGSTRKGLSFSLVDPYSGVQQGAFYTESINTGQSVFVQDMGTAPGKLYFTASFCASDTCSSGPIRLYSVRMAKLGMDYPRGALLGITPVAFDKMAVGGDSFSAGVGSLLSGQSYDAGTDTDGCDRSPNAYAYQLAQNPLVKLRLPSSGFVACSGATTDAITNTFHGETAQAATIPSDTKSIFITIGGNDVKFSRFGALCIFLDCSAQQYQDEFDGYLASVQSSLEGAYEAFLNHATGAKLYVIGYPHILPLSDCTNTGSAWWDGLQAEHAINPTVYAQQAEDAGLTHDEGQEAIWQIATISNAEATYTNTFENNLNLKISDAVDAVAENYPGRIFYVSANAPGGPLVGHELCSPAPYFNGLDGADDGINTFHPNAPGQAALAQVAKDALAVHQPQYVLAG